MAIWSKNLKKEQLKNIYVLQKKYIAGKKKKSPTYGRHQPSRLMRMVGPMQIWRGCEIFHYSFLKGCRMIFLNLFFPRKMFAMIFLKKKQQKIEGGGLPMMSQDRIILSEDQWEALEKIALDGANRNTDKQTDRWAWRLLDQLGPVGPSSWKWYPLSFPIFVPNFGGRNLTRALQ